MEHYKLQKLQNILKVYIKVDKNIIKFGDTEIQKHKCHEHKSLISINNIDI